MLEMKHAGNPWVPGNPMGTCLAKISNLSVFRTRGPPQSTSEFYVACPCPDGLMQDETQEGG
jgi:hypothetical protein